MIIQHNITALNAYNRLSTNNSTVSKNLEKLSSGYRINRAGDDAAGLAISEKMRAQITGLERATLNAQDGISLVQTAEGALTEVHSMLNRMVELGTQSANGTYQAEDRQKIQSEVDALLGEVDRISQATNFNGINLLDGTLGLDTDAFKSTYNNAVSASGLTTVENIKLGSASVAAAKGTYSVDLGDLAVAAEAEGTLKISIGGKNIEIKLDKAVAAAGDKTSAAGAGALKVAAGSQTGYVLGTQGRALTTAELGAELVKIVSNALSDVNAGAVVTDPKVPSKVAGEPAQKVTVAFAAGRLSITQTAAPNNEKEVIDIDKDYKVSYEGATGVSGRVAHQVRVDSISTAASAATKAEADISFDVSALSNGSTLTIGNKTFTFVTKDENKATLVAGDVDLRAYTEADLKLMEKTDLQKLVGQSITAASSRTGQVHAPTDWNITTNTDGSLHLDQTTASIVNFSTKASIINDLTSTTIAKEAGVSIDLDESLIRKGTSIKIGDQMYEFTDDKKSISNKNAVAVVISGLTSSSNPSAVGAATEALAKVVNGPRLDAKVDATDVQKLNILTKTAGGKAPMIAGKGLTLQIGDTADSFNQVTVAVEDMGTVGLGIDGLKVTDQGWSQESIDKIKASIEKVSVNRGNLGALQNRLEHTINNLTTTTENMTAAESRVRDTDMAKEMMDFTKNNVLVQAAQAMLAQANQQPQQVLQLLR